MEQGFVVKGVRGSAPPPFLTKTFKMVEDPATNNIICWNSCGTSLIILDHLNFASQILPSYFKHSNFSSFLYQLNNYGFKKIGLRQYEYENKWFQAGKEHLLININRRSNQSPSTKQRRIPITNCSEDMEKVTSNINFFKLEIPILKRQLGNLENRVDEFQRKLEEMQSKSDKLMAFLRRVFGPGFVGKKPQHVEGGEEEEEEGELHSHELMVKKRRFFGPESSENSAPNDSIIIPEKIETKEYDPCKIWEKIVGDNDDSESENNINEWFPMAAFDEIFAEMMCLNGKALNFKDLDDEVTFELWA